MESQAGRAGKFRGKKGKRNNKGVVKLKVSRIGCALAYPLQEEVAYIRKKSTAIDIESAVLSSAVLLANPKLGLG